MRKIEIGNVKLTTSSLQEFLALTNNIRKSWNFDTDDVCGPWYRGQQRKNWSLLPNIVRMGCYFQSTEDDIREEFAVQAPALSRFEPFPMNDWDQYFLMQHYGAPTRLLDWTESPVIALYFAVRDNLGYYDSAVWMLDPYELNKRVIRKEEVVAPSALGVNPKDKKHVDPWLPKRWSLSKLIPDWPLAIFPTHIARRISSQKSCFTIHGKKEDGFSRFISTENPCLKKIVIPGHSVRDIRLELKNYGIDEATIFPDLEGLGRALATRYRAEIGECPHQDVYVRIKPSKSHKGGVGVFAIKSIPKNTRVFVGENEEILWVSKNALPKAGSLRMLYNDFAIIKDGRYGCPTSFNRLTPAWFLNESKTPNIRCDENYDFYTLRSIRSGEELTVDYATFSEYPDWSKR